MRFGLSQQDPVAGTATIFRLLAVALAGLALVLEGRPIGPATALLGSAYLAASGLLWLVAPRLDRSWLAYPSAVLDALAATALLVLSPSPTLPLWALYLFPLACAAAAGRGPAAVSAGLAAAGYLGAAWLAAGGLSAAELWPVVLLEAAAFVMAGLAGRWRAEARRRRAWQEVDAVARGLLGGGEPAEAAARVVGSARRLVRAARAGLWWCEDGGRLRPGPQAGPPAAAPLLGGGLTDALARRLERGPVPLAEFGGPAAAFAGEVLAVRAAGARLALVAVAWDDPPGDLAALRERLRLFVPWAGDALARARARAEARERLRREGVLRQAAAELAATLERRAVEEAVVRAARAGLGSAAALVERCSGQLVAGDPELVEAVVKLTLDRQAPPAEAGTTPARPPEPLLTGQIGQELALLVRRAEPPFADPDAAWLEGLAGLAAAALDRCAAHERLQFQRNRLQAGLEAVPAPLALWDAGGNLLLANAAYRALGSDVVPPGELPTSDVAEREATLGDPPRTFVVLTAAAADLPYYVSVYRDITREREALRAKDELIALVGHELRNPLASIHGYSQLMARQLGIVQRQLDQLNRLVGDFMDASGLEGGQLPIAREPVDLAMLARAAAERFGGAHQGRALRLDLADVPPVDGDPARLGQVLDNLLSNAAKYSSAEGEIVLELRADDGQVILAVRDQGVGIAPEHLPQVFDRFYRAPGEETERVKGLGLGLSIARDLVAAHGGRIWADSAGPGRGSTFRVALPVSRDAGASPNRPARVGG